MNAGGMEEEMEADELVGTTIAGKYRLNRLLGTGGMATVWSATNVFTEREFAVKFMLPQVARTPEAARVVADFPVDPLSGPGAYVVTREGTSASERRVGVGQKF